MRKVIAYTDGSAVGNPKSKSYRLGGYGVYLKYYRDNEKFDEFFFHEGFSDTKIGRMELTAIIIAMQKVIDKSVQLIIYSDSEYAVNCIRKSRLFEWERNDWKGLANVDLLKKYIYEFRQFKIKPIIHHIKGHREVTTDNTEGNNIADVLADYKSFKKYKKDIR